MCIFLNKDPNFVVGTEVKHKGDTDKIMEIKSFKSFYRAECQWEDDNGTKHNYTFKIKELEISDFHPYKLGKILSS